MTRRRKRTWHGARWNPRKQQSIAGTTSSAVLGLAVVLFFIWILRLGTAPPGRTVASDSWLPPCPIGGKPINFAHELATVAGPVFFCCEHCAEKYEAYPSKYRENLRKQREVLAGLPRVQVTCPVSGDVVDAAVSVDHEGNAVFFCRKECLPKFQADPDAYRGKLAASYTHQTKCPVSGKPIDPRASATLPRGEKVYFCSDQCREEFLGDPASFAAKLAEQGLKIHL